MLDTERQKTTYRFGVFELDMRTGELRKHGVRLKLQQQPLQLLSILLERAGDVVTRGDVQKRLWPDDTYVDFDNAINSSIRNLREALGDSADSPRFIETLPRQGYRFIVAVSQQSAAVAAASAASGNGFNSPAPQTETHGDLTKAHRRRSRWIASAAAAIVVVGVGLALLFSKGKSNPEDVNALLRAVPFTSYPGFEVLPDFSPEGTRVAFSGSDREAVIPTFIQSCLVPANRFG